MFYIDAFKIDKACGLIEFFYSTGGKIIGD